MARVVGRRGMAQGVIVRGGRPRSRTSLPMMSRDRRGRVDGKVGRRGGRR
uniref:Uncharacterized protein n=1 Tax=Arundo donax TaxID=35708 RepID=A0A0A9AIL9_ARUDO